MFSGAPIASLPFAAIVLASVYESSSSASSSSSSVTSSSSSQTSSSSSSSLSRTSSSSSLGDRDLTGKVIEFVAYDRRTEEVKFTLTGIVSGATVTVNSTDVNTQVAATYGWVLRNTTDDTVLQRGTLVVVEVPDAG